MNKTVHQKRHEANQRLINEAHAHVNRNGRPSFKGTYPKIQCIYSGIGCAFSPAIKPEYRENADDLSLGAAGIIDTHSHILQDWAKYVHPLIADLVQDCHDGCLGYCNFLDPDVTDSFTEEFNKRLRQLCESEGYKFPGDE